MTRYTVTQTITNVRLTQPLISATDVKAENMTQLVKRLKLSGKQECDLKNYQKTAWLDEHGSLFVLEIQKHDTIQ